MRMSFYLLTATPLSFSSPSLWSYMQSQRQSHALQSDSGVLEPNHEQPDAPTNLSTYLEPECIIGSTDRQGELMFLVKW